MNERKRHLTELNNVNLACKVSQQHKSFSVIFAIHKTCIINSSLFPLKVAVKHDIISSQKAGGVLGF
jgi:hypothetical protein